MTNLPQPTALVSWAHRNPGWSDDLAEQWLEQVLCLATLLRNNGVDADLDLWHDNNAAVDWTRWGQSKVEDSEFVIIVVSQAWKERWEGTNSPVQGAGAVAEADALKGRFQQDQAAFQKRTVLVMLPGVGDEIIPKDLFRLFRTYVASMDDSGIEALLRTVHGRPTHAKPNLGSVPELPPKASAPNRTEIASVRAELDQTISGSNLRTNPGSRSSATPGKSSRKVGTLKKILGKPPVLSVVASPEDLDAAVFRQTFSTWDKETALFRTVSAPVDCEAIGESLRLAYDAKLISRLGPRVHLFDSDFHVRFLEPSVHADVDVLTLQLETPLGRLLERFPWAPSQTPVELLSLIAGYCFRSSNFQGAFGFFPSTIFGGLSEMLVEASEARKGLSDGSREAYTNVVEIVDGYWILTEERITPRDRLWYGIELDRLDEIDWVTHIQGKQWDRQSGIDAAIALGRRLLEAQGKPL